MGTDPTVYFDLAQRHGWYSVAGPHSFLIARLG